jgi:hypothetical protein
MVDMFDGRVGIAIHSLHATFMLAQQIQLTYDLHSGRGSVNTRKGMNVWFRITGANEEMTP